MTTIDAYRCAKMLLDQHGPDADLHAATRADELGDNGDEAGRRAWLAIIAAIEELTRTKPLATEKVQYRRLRWALGDGGRNGDAGRGWQGGEVLVELALAELAGSRIDRRLLRLPGKLIGLPKPVELTAFAASAVSFITALGLSMLTLGLLACANTEGSKAMFYPE